VTLGNTQSRGYFEHQASFYRTSNWMDASVAFDAISQPAFFSFRAPQRLIRRVLTGVPGVVNRLLCSGRPSRQRSMVLFPTEQRLSTTRKQPLGRRGPETAFGEITSSGSQILATRDAAAD